MSAKEFLSRGFFLKKEIRAKELQIEKLRDMRAGISNTVSISKSNGNGFSNKMADLTVTLIDLENEYLQDIDKLLVIKDEIKNVVDSVTISNYKLLLSLRYESCLTWSTIAEVMDYEERHLRRLHKQALKSIKSPVMSACNYDIM